MAEQSSQIVNFLPEWDGASYAANAGHHRVFDAAFLATLPFEGHERVLDLCCGSGEFTRTIADLVPAGHVVGLDAQPSMLDEARACAGSNQSFVLGPVQHLDTLVPESGTFDLVMSRSALHWVPEQDHPALLAECFRLLRPGGRLRIECGGGDNVRTMMALFGDCSAKRGGPRCPWTYFGAGVDPRARRSGRLRGRGRMGAYGGATPEVRPRELDRLADLAVLPGLRSASPRVGARGLSG